MSEFIPYTTEELLDLFKASYYDQTGQTLRIGSDEFAFSAVASYVLRVFEQSLQHGANQCTLETATGAALDAIGATYGLNRGDLSQTARCGLTLTNTTGSAITVDREELFWENDETEFINKFPYEVPAGATVNALMYATEGGTKFNGITGIVPQEIAGITFGTASMTYGGADAPFDYAQENDDIYRAYIKQNLKSFTVGTPGYYENAALAGNSGILTSAYCLRDGDTISGDSIHSFEAGKAKIFIAFEWNETSGSLGTYAFRMALADTIQRILSMDNHRCVTDFVEVNTVDVAEFSTDVVSIEMALAKVVYESRFDASGSDGQNIAQKHYYNTIRRYKKMLLETIGKPFIEGEFQAMLQTPDENGVYASAFYCELIDPNDPQSPTNYVYWPCPKGKVIHFAWSSPTIEYI